MLEQNTVLNSAAQQWVKSEEMSRSKTPFVLSLHRCRLTCWVPLALYVFNLKIEFWFGHVSELGVSGQINCFSADSKKGVDLNSRCRTENEVVNIWIMYFAWYLCFEKQFLSLISLFFMCRPMPKEEPTNQEGISCPKPLKLILLGFSPNVSQFGESPVIITKSKWSR